MCREPVASISGVDFDAILRFQNVVNIAIEKGYPSDDGWLSAKKEG